MGTAERKARERQERQRLILDTAHVILVEHGYLGLTVDRIAEAIEYSKGTVYQHFTSKEEIVVALANRLHQDFLPVLASALAYPGRPRERLYAGMVLLILMYANHPELALFESIGIEPSIWSKASDEERESQRGVIDAYYRNTQSLVTEAVEKGDFHAPDWQVSEILMSLWSVAFGNRLLTFQLSQTHKGANWLPDGYFDYTTRIVGAFLDGIGWRPLAADRNYGEIERWVKTDLPANCP